VAVALLADRHRVRTMFGAARFSLLANAVAVAVGSQHQDQRPAILDPSETPVTASSAAR